MGRPKISVVGSGHVGSTIAHCAVTRDLADIVLIDAVEGLPQGIGLDLAEMRPLENAACGIVGTNSYEDTADSDVVVITAGSPRKPGMSRDDLLAKNKEIVKSVTSQVVEHSPNCILVIVSNPLDLMCHVALQVSGFPKERVIGQAGVLDSSRMRSFIADELGVSPQDINTLVLGGHGDFMVPLIRYTHAGGIPVQELIPQKRLDEIVERTRKAGSEIVSHLQTGSAFYSPATSTIEMVEAILRDKKRILACSAYVEGEYDIHDVFVGVPIILGAGGIEKILELDIAEDEKKSLQDSADHIKEMAAKLDI